MASTNNLVSSISIPGNAIDLFPLNGETNEANINRLGGFSGNDTLISAGSDLLATLKWTQLSSVNIV